MRGAGIFVRLPVNLHFVLSLSAPTSAMNSDWRLFFRRVRIQHYISDLRRDVAGVRPDLKRIWRVHSCLGPPISWKLWEARSRLYRNRFLQADMRLAAFFKLYNICTLLHRSKFKNISKFRLFSFASFPIVSSMLRLICMKLWRRCTIFRRNCQNLIFDALIQKNVS